MQSRGIRERLGVLGAILTGGSAVGSALGAPAWVTNLLGVGGAILLVVGLTVLWQDIRTALRNRSIRQRVGDRLFATGARLSGRTVYTDEQLAELQGYKARAEAQALFDQLGVFDREADAMKLALADVSRMPPDTVEVSSAGHWAGVDTWETNAAAILPLAARAAFLAPIPEGALQSDAWNEKIRHYIEIKRVRLDRIRSMIDHDV